jgi:hypothetical protein
LIAAASFASKHSNHRRIHPKLLRRAPDQPARNTNLWADLACRLYSTAATLLPDERVEIQAIAN